MRKAKIAAVTAACTLSALLTACGGDSSLYTAGTYTGVGKGKGGDVKVEVEFSESEILSIVIDENNNETPEIAAFVYDELPDDLLEAQSTEVDTIGGATFTSQGVIEAVADCIDQASLK